ncbi:MAG: hypothetical protein ACRC6M_03625 [Microcystaceae cyanobacterium]
MTAFCLNERHHPIPAPNHPRQYRAIGLVYGQYYPSGESVNRGVLSTEQGALVEAVLLGRMMSLVKKHLDLSKPHLWVVYPRMRDPDGHLHFQLAGVWEPETLKSHLSRAIAGQSVIDHQRGLFSIRGEVILAEPAEKTIILKIRQSPRPDPEQPEKIERPKSFKIKLQGLLSERPLGHFWDLEVQLQRDRLIILSAKDLGFVITKKVPRSHSNSKPFRKSDFSPPSQGDRYGSRIRDRGTERPSPIAKPIKKT